MTDSSLAQVDELLTELVELVETARTVPMSSSCVVPRERTLDLLDGLREVLPSEIGQSRRIVAEQDRILAQAVDSAAQSKKSADLAAAETVAQAQAQAQEILAQAVAEQQRLVHAETVHREAAERAEVLREQAELYADQLREQAELYADQLREQAAAAAAQTTAQAEQAARALTGNAAGYAEATLAELIATLQRMTATAENGRATVAQRPVA